MVAKEELHRMVDNLTAADAEKLVTMLRTTAGASYPGKAPRPLRADDIVLDKPIMPDDETADELIAAVREWRRSGGYV